MDIPTNDPLSPRCADPALRLALQAVPGCAALVNLQGILEVANGTWSKATSANPFVLGLVPGCNYMEHCQALTRSEHGDISLVALSLVSALQGKIRHIKLEYPVDGSEQTWFSMTATGLQDESGVVIAHLDVTERMAWERRVRRNEMLFKATTENALELIAILAGDGRTVYASPSYAVALGYPLPTLGKGKLQDLVCPKDLVVFREQCRSGLVNGMSPLFEYGAHHRDGHILHLEARAVAVDNPGGERDAILLISRDISAKKAAEVERTRMEAQLRDAQKMEAVGLLSAGIAHEINTPCQFLCDNLKFLQEAFAGFATVTGNLDAALTDPAFGHLAELEPLKRHLSEQDIPYLTEEVPRAIQQSLEGLARITRIVQAMKVFGHPGGEERVAVDLNETLQNTVVVAQGEWKHVAEVRLDLAPDLPKVSACAGEMNQVFLNLVVNAAHAIVEKASVQPGHMGRITLTTRVRDTWIEVLVADTGAGIPDTIRDRIFLPFFTTKAVGKGTGQGLSIAHSVITKSGGTIEYESMAGEGTRFIVRLPALPLAEAGSVVTNGNN